VVISHMLQLIFDNRTVFQFASAGNLINNGGFLHGDRCLDTFVLLVGNAGKLHIVQNNKEHTLCKDQFMILFPGYRHFGYKKSEEQLKYYWCHFYIKPEQYQIIQDNIPTEPLTGTLSSHDSEYISLLPEYGDCLHPERVHLQFRHLIDNSRTQPRLASMLDFSISLLVLEILHMYALSAEQKRSAQRMSALSSSVIDYVNHNYTSNISVAQLANKMGYNANYLSTTFKKKTGYSLLHYINIKRINAAKDLLLNSSNSIKFIADQVGFSDEKHFMKLFRSMENTTPTKYRNAYLQNHVNTK
jgi:YesN/AraC family two-component response regulator